MKKIIVLCFVVNLFTQGYSQSNKMAVDCSCPSGWGSCSSSCLFTDCCICFNPATSEGGCACYWGFGSCRTAPAGSTKVSGIYASDGAKVSFSFDRFDEMLKYLLSQKIDVSALSTNFQAYKGKYPSQAGKIPVQNADFNSFGEKYTAFINGLTAAQKNIVQVYIDNKEKTN